VTVRRRRCVILDDYQNAVLKAADWTALKERLDIVIHQTHINDAAELHAALEDAQIIVVNRERTPLSETLLRLLPKLELIVTTGMANAAIDIAAAARLGKTVCGTRNAGNPTAELTWALILASIRHLDVEISNFRAAGPWQSSVGGDLAGRTLGLLGLGRVGAQVARVADAFGMRVAAWTPKLDAKRAAAAGVERASTIEALFATSDILSIHVPLTDETRGLVGEKLLSAMQPHALLVNTSRGPVVQEDALLSALRSRTIAAAALDVFDVEPLPADHPYRKTENLIATPHLGYVTRSNYAAYFGDVVEDIAAWLDGTPVRVLAMPDNGAGN